MIIQSQEGSCVLTVLTWMMVHMASGNDMAMPHLRIACGEHAGIDRMSRAASGRTPQMRYDEIPGPGKVKLKSNRPPTKLPSTNPTSKWQQSGSLAMEIFLLFLILSLDHRLLRIAIALCIALQKDRSI